MDTPKQTKRRLSESGPPSYENSYADVSVISHVKPGDTNTAGVNEPVNPTGGDEQAQKKTDAELVSAAEALTRLNNVTPSPPSDESRAHSQFSSPLSGTPTQNAHRPLHPIVQSVNTISKLSLVSNAVKYYETSKRNSATFNYAAGIVEKAAMPVFSKIEVNLNNIHQTRLENRAKVKRRKRANCCHDKKDIKKRIKFCLHVLKLANENISAKVTDLQDKMKDTSEISRSDETLSEHDNLQGGALSPVSTDSQYSTGSTLIPEKTQDTNSEIAATVKKIIHIISNFRPSSLNVDGEETPDANGDEGDVKLRSTIREIIFKLPSQVSQNSTSSSQKAPATDKVIVFARESLDMIGRLTSVFNEQLEKAESWVDGPVADKSPNTPKSPGDGDEDLNNSSQGNSVVSTDSPSYVLTTEKRFHLE